MQLSSQLVKKILAFDTLHREITTKGKPTVKTLCYNVIVPHTKTKNPKKRDVTVANVAVKLANDGKPILKVVSFADLSTATKDGQLTIHYRDMGYHFLAGWHVYWDEAEYERKCVNSWICSAGFGNWDTYKYKHRCGLSFPWNQTVNPCDLQNTRYRYCQFGTVGNTYRLIDWLMLYRADSRVELLVKAGLTSLINPAGLKALKDKRFFDYVKTHLNEMKDASANHCSVKDMLWCYTHDTSWQEAKDHFDFVRDLRQLLPTNHSCYHGLKTDTPLDFKLDYERLRKTLPKWGIEKQEYARYLYEVIDAGLDTKCEGNLYPPVRDGRKSFMARLESLEAENAKRHRKEERERKKAEREARKKAKAAEAIRLAKEQEIVKKTLASRLKEIAAFQKSVDKVMKLNINGATCVIAKSQDELRKEGKRMNNCVGIGTYGRGTVLGDTLILQFKDKRGHSWCDAEIDRSNWKVRQCYSRGNNVAPDEIKSISETIAKTLKAQHLANRKANTFPALNQPTIKRRCA